MRAAEKHNVFFFLKRIEDLMENISCPLLLLRLITVHLQFSCINRRKALWLIISIGGHFIAQQSRGSCKIITVKLLQHKQVTNEHKEN